METPATTPVQPAPAPKEKKPRTEAQLKAFEKARESLKVKNEAKQFARKQEAEKVEAERVALETKVKAEIPEAEVKVMERRKPKPAPKPKMLEVVLPEPEPEPEPEPMKPTRKPRAPRAPRAHMENPQKFPEVQRGVFSGAENVPQQRVPVAQPVPQNTVPPNPYMAMLAQRMRR